MSQLNLGTYIIAPVIANGEGEFGVGFNFPIYPPQDLPLNVVTVKASDRWVIKASDNDTYTVFTGKGKSDDYKWVLKNNDLFVSSVRQQADSFKFELTDDIDVCIIGLPDQDAVLTADITSIPQLTFKPADGSDAQRFKVIRIN